MLRLFNLIPSFHAVPEYSHRYAPTSSVFNSLLFCPRVTFLLYPAVSHHLAQMWPFSFQMYAASVVIYRVLTFNNCEAAAAELKKVCAIAIWLKFLSFLLWSITQPLFVTFNAQCAVFIGCIFIVVAGLSSAGSLGRLQASVCMS